MGYKIEKLKTYGASERFIAEASMYPGLHLGRVTTQHKGVYQVVTEQGSCMAEVSGKFRFEAKRLADYPAVGDFVMLDRIHDKTGNAIIHHILRRKSSFERTSVENENETQVVATNIDFVFLCMSLNANYSLNRMERYLSIAWSSGATPVVVLTKADLCDDAESKRLEVEGVAPGVDVIVTSSLDDTYEKLLPFLKEGVSASFIGSSGVGKSTLINHLAGTDILATSEVREDGKGRHTTTRRELNLLPSGGVVIDTPGMREMGAESVDLSKSFADIDALAAQCRFRDCTHTREPGCAVLAAVRDGTLGERRMESYRKLGREAKYDGLNARQIENEKISTMFGSKNEMKQMRDFFKQKNKHR
jgi:ribosome biogenesis GTPase